LRVRSKRDVDAIEKALKDLLDDAIKEEVLVFVEGKKDYEAVLRLGFKGNRIIKIKNNNRYRNLYELVEAQMPLREVLILTDFDEEGVALAKKLAAIVTEYGGRPLTRLRMSLHKLLKGRITEIESISYVF